MDLIMLFSDLFDTSVNSCLTDFFWDEKKHAFSLVLEWFNSYIGMVYVVFFFFFRFFFSFPFIHL